MTVLLETNINNSTRFSIEDAGSALSFKKYKTPNYRYIMHRLAGFSPEEYNDMEYDLSESARIIDTEALVQASFRKKRQLILKNGYQLFSKNERNLAYIKRRLDEFECVTSQSFRDLLVEVVENMVNFNNCFILKYRKDEHSSGLIREKETGGEIKPIAGLFVLAAPTIDTASNAKTGQIVKYRHRITEKYSRQFRPDDIFHMFENKRVGITIGTPPLEAVKDDIFLLRSIEQDTESLIHRHANPFMLVQVGTDKSPARVLGDGSSEIDVYADLIDRIDTQGGASVPHRVDVKYLGAESQALRLESYLTYFKQRVLTGLAISETDLGNGHGISGTSGELVSNSMREDIRSYQKTIENFITNYIFNELLLEAPFYKGEQWIPTEERVTINFLEPDLDKRIKIESHYLLLYQSGLISQEAALQKMEFELEDKGPGVLLGKENNNSVQSSISNNIIAPKNQHSVADSLNITHYKSITSYYRRDFNEFIENLKQYYPEDIIDNNINYLEKVFNKLENILLTSGMELVNNYVEETLFELITKNT